MRIVVHPAWPISNDRAAMSSWRKFRNLPWVSCFAVNSQQASMCQRQARPGPLSPQRYFLCQIEIYGKAQSMSENQTALDPRFQNLDGFRVEIDPSRERGDIILARPPMNTISMRQRDELRKAFEALDEDPRVRVIVLRAEGEHFSSGGYIRGFLEASPEHVSTLAWDFRIVSETCLYALPEQKLGQIPGSGGSARLQKIVGITRAKDIVMRSKRIPGPQAVAWGIATECVPDDKLEATVDALVEELRSFSPLAQRTAKKLLNDTEDATLSIAIELEGQCYSRLRQSDDFREGVEAFHAKRAPKFRGT